MSEFNHVCLYCAILKADKARESQIKFQIFQKQHEIH